MTSPATQFAPSRRMGIYDPLHQISMWEDTFKAEISPNTGVSIISQVDEMLKNKSEYVPYESLEPSGINQEPRITADKVQRRLAQNREAARKSRLRKKAYVQQLETSRLKLAHLEEELQRSRHQGAYIGGMLANGISGLPVAVTSGIAAFEMEYGHWMEEQQKNNCELKNVLQAHISDTDLRILVESGLAHYNDLFRMKAEAAKADVFYVLSGVWRTSVEKLFLWIGGFRPSEILNILKPELEPLTDQQIENVYNLQHSCKQAEDALSQGLDKLQQTVVQSITVDTIGSGNYNYEMASAIEKLVALEGFVNQADHLRRQTLQQMSRILTTRQAARGLIALGDYFQRLRALSSLWAARPHEPN